MEDAIQNEIKKTLLKREPGTVKDVYWDVKRICKSKNLNVPGMTTIRDRFLRISEQERVASRQGKKVLDEEKLRLDFLPAIERTVQEYGVLMDHIYYYDDILRSRTAFNDIDMGTCRIIDGSFIEGLGV